MTDADGDRDRSHQIRDRDEISYLPRDLDVGGSEFQCADCLARCTESPRGDVEYGHRPECDHSIRQGAPASGRATEAVKERARGEAAGGDP